MFSDLKLFIFNVVNELQPLNIFTEFVTFEVSNEVISICLIFIQNWNIEDISFTFFVLKDDNCNDVK